MVFKIEVMEIKEKLHRKIFIYVMKRVIEKVSKKNLKHYFHKYLSQSDTCQLESA